MGRKDKIQLGNTQNFEAPESAAKPKLKRKEYEEQIAKLHRELVKLQFWVKRTGTRIIVLFEGRDAAGKGGVIKRITERVSPRVISSGCSSRPVRAGAITNLFSTIFRAFPGRRRNRSF
jgi:polyphosphate kinase 2 (PPK2 family)